MPRFLGVILDLNPGSFQIKRKKNRRLETKNEGKIMNVFKSYSLSKFDLKKGNIYKYVDKETFNWLIDEAITNRVDNLGIIIAAIIKDAHYEGRDKEH